MTCYYDHKNLVTEAKLYMLFALRLFKKKNHQFQPQSDEI